MLTPISTDKIPPRGCGGSPGLSLHKALHPSVSAVGLPPQPRKLVPAAGNYAQASAELAAARHSGCGAAFVSLLSPPASSGSKLCTWPTDVHSCSSAGRGVTVEYGALHKARLLASGPQWQVGPVRAPQYRSLSSSLTPMLYGITEHCLPLGPSSIFCLTAADSTPPAL